MANGVRNKDQTRVDHICNLVVEEMNQSFYFERDFILCAAKVPELRYTLPQSGEVIPSKSPSFSGSSDPSNYSILLNGSKLFQNVSPPPPVNYEQSPFYNLTEPATTPIVIPKTTSGSQSKYLVTINFQFSHEQSTLVKKDKLALVLMSVNSAEALKNGTAPTHISFPYQTFMAVNGKPYTDSLRGIKGKPGTTRPADLTKYVNKSTLNDIHVHISDPTDAFILRLYLAVPIAVDEIVKKVLARPAIKKQDTINTIKNRGTDDDIEELSIVVNIKCPLAGSRIQTPVRSIYCDHFECFDLTSFILLQQQATTWRCPVCNTTIKYNDLAVDEYMTDVLEHVKIYDINEVEILPDGTWKMAADASLLEDDDYDSDVPVEHRSENRDKSSFVPDDAVVISLDSDDEEDAQQPAPSVTSPPLVLPPIPQPTPLSGSHSTPLLSSAQPTPPTQSVNIPLPLLPLSTNPVADTITNTREPDTSASPQDFSREELFQQMPTWKSSLFGHRRPRNPKADDTTTHENITSQDFSTLSPQPPYMFNSQYHNDSSRQPSTEQVPFPNSNLTDVNSDPQYNTFGNIPSMPFSPALPNILNLPSLQTDQNTNSISMNISPAFDSFHRSIHQLQEKYRGNQKYDNPDSGSMNLAANANGGTGSSFNMHLPEPINSNNPIYGNGSIRYNSSNTSNGPNDTGSNNPIDSPQFGSKGPLKSLFGSSSRSSLSNILQGPVELPVPQSLAYDGRHRTHQPSYSSSLSAASSTITTPSLEHGNDSGNKPRHGVKRTAAELNEENSVIDLTLTDDDEEEVQIVPQHRR